MKIDTKYTMKPIKIFTMSALLLLAACGGQEVDKKEKLKQLEKQYAELGVEIQQLKAEIQKSGGKLEEPQGKTIAIVKPEPATFIHSIDVLGKVDGEENVKLGAQMGGNVVRVNAGVGDKVSKGQILVETDNAAMVQAIEEVKSQREFANTLYQKQKRLWEQNIGSEVQYLSAKNNVDALDKRIATLQQQIDMTRIKSPITGIIDQFDVKPGQMLVPGMPVISVVNNSKLKIKAELAESYINKVKPGNRVIVSVPDAGKQIETRIKYSGQAVNSLNRTFNVEMPLTKDQQNGLLPNMSAKVQIIDYEKPNAIVLPESMVQKSAKGYYVMIAEPGKDGKYIARKKVVTVGETYNGKIEIAGGLTTSDNVISAGYLGLNEGEEITVSK